MVRCLWVLIVLTSAPSWGAGFSSWSRRGNLAAGGTGVSGGVVGYGHWYNPAMLSLTKARWTSCSTGRCSMRSFSFLRSREGLVPPERLADMSEGQQAALMANCCGSSPDQPVLDEAPARQIPFIGLAVPVRPDTVVGLAVYGPQGPRGRWTRTALSVTAP